MFQFLLHQASKDCKKFYDSYNLMESTTRTNLTSLAIMKLRSSRVDSLEGFRTFVDDLFEELCNFDKFGGLAVKEELLDEVVTEEVTKLVQNIMVVEAIDDSVEELFDDELPDPEEDTDSVEEITDKETRTEEIKETKATEDTRDEVVENRKGAYIEELLIN